MPDTPAKPRSRKLARLAATLIVLTVLAICVAVPIYARSAIRHAFDAETRLQSLMVTARAVNTFALAQDPPRWPNSWDELATVECDHPWLPWPAERTTIEQSVTIDFDATLEAVLAQPVDSINAIRPSGDAFTGWRSDVWHALQPAREKLAP